MSSLGKNIGAEIITRANLAAPAAEAALNGKAEDITLLGARANSVRGVVAIRFNADSGDTLNVSAIKLQSSVDSGFTTPVDRVTASAVVLTGADGASNADMFSEVPLDLDLTALPAAHKFLRLTATPTRSDTTNTTAAIGGVLIFGGLDDAPRT